MAKPVQEVVLLHSQTITASGNSAIINVPSDYLGAILYLNVGAVTGTSPALNIWIQQGFRTPGAGDTSDGLMFSAATSPTLWDDFASFANPIGATGVTVMRIVAEIGTSAANSPTASVIAGKSGTLAASTVQAGPLGLWWRVLWTVGGTSPSFASVFITAQFMMNQS